VKWWPGASRSRFTPRDGDSSRRRREAFLVASSYGAVYGVVSQNGRRLYVVDTVNRTEYALDMSAEPRRLAVKRIVNMLGDGEVESIADFSAFLLSKRFNLP